MVARLRAKTGARRVRVDARLARAKGSLTSEQGQRRTWLLPPFPVRPTRGRPNVVAPLRVGSHATRRAIRRRNRRKRAQRPRVKASRRTRPNTYAIWRRPGTGANGCVWLRMVHLVAFGCVSSVLAPGGEAPPPGDLRRTRGDLTGIAPRKWHRLWLLGRPCFSRRTPGRRSRPYSAGLCTRRLLAGGEMAAWIVRHICEIRTAAGQSAAYSSSVMRLIWAPVNASS